MLELLGAVLAARLAKKGKDSSKVQFGKTRFFTDSAAVQSVLQNGSVAFQEFVGSMDSEIKTGYDVESEQSWIPTDKNLANLGTEDNVRVADMEEESEYQEGKLKMMMPEQEWPSKKKISLPSTEEMREGVVATTCHVAINMEPFIKYSTTLTRTLRVCGYVFLFLSRLRRETTNRLQVAARDGQKVKSGPPPHIEKVAQGHLVEEAQKNLAITGLLGRKRTHWMAGTHLMAKMEIQLEADVFLTRSMQFLDEIKIEFWPKRMELMSGGMVPGFMRKGHPGLKVAYVVLLKEEPLATCDYRLGRVVKVSIGQKWP